MKKNFSTKAVAAILAAGLLVGGTVGGTLVWLMDSTESIKNTFTVGDVAITLEEHKYGADNKVTTEVSNEITYPLIPGTSYGKDPKVTVTETSEDCYLFIRIEEINNPSTYLTYTYNLDGWTAVEGEGTSDCVYYRTVTKGTGKDGWYLLNAIGEHSTGGVTVKDTIVSANATAGSGEVNMPSSSPEIKFTAYAVQTANLTMEEAWAEVDPTPSAGN